MEIHLNDSVLNLRFTNNCEAIVPFIDFASNSRATFVVRNRQLSIYNNA